MLASIPIEWFYPTHQEDPNIYNDLDFDSYFAGLLAKRANSIKGILLQIPPFPARSTLVQETIRNCCVLIKEHHLPVYLQGMSNLMSLDQSSPLTPFFSLTQMFPGLMIKSVDSEIVSALIASGRALVKSEDSNLPVSVIDLNDVRYVSDGTPIQQDCPCYACVHHTKSYVHHLLNVKEMLAQVLLSL